MSQGPPPLSATPVTKDFITKFHFLKYSQGNEPESLDSDINIIVTYDLFTKFLEKNVPFSQVDWQRIVQNFSRLNDEAQDLQLKHCKKWLFDKVGIQDLEAMGVDDDLLDSWSGFIKAAS